MPTAGSDSAQARHCSSRAFRARSRASRLASATPVIMRRSSSIERNGFSADVCASTCLDCNPSEGCGGTPRGVLPLPIAHAYDKETATVARLRRVMRNLRAMDVPVPIDWNQNYPAGSAALHRHFRFRRADANRQRGVHGSGSPHYSARSAATGSMEAAPRAGKYAAIRTMLRSNPAPVRKTPASTVPRARPAWCSMQATRQGLRGQ